MPIKPENKKLYPKNWNEISERIRFKRADHKCEVCGVPNYAIGHRDNKGAFIPVSGNIYLDLYGQGLDLSLKPVVYRQVAAALKVLNNDERRDKKYIMIVLTVAHLDHNPTNCHDNNLKAMCQKCHLNYDSKHHSQTRARTKRANLEKSGQLSLF